MEEKCGGVSVWVSMYGVGGLVCVCDSLLLHAHVRM